MRRLQFGPERRTAWLIGSASIVAALASARIGRADPLLPAADASGGAAALAALADGFQRQQDVFATRETGLSLDTIFQPDAVPTVRAFFAQTATTDFEAFSGMHPFAAVQAFDEYGDEGNFAGITSVGVAARLMVLRGAGAPPTAIDAAREAAIRAAKAWHVYATIGGPGIVARGIRRVAPLDPSDPPLPEAPPSLTPLADAQGNALPADKRPTWRAPVLPGLDGWIWIDDTSKDQVAGYALAVAWLWDALHDDPLAPAGLADSLAVDLTAFVRELMKVVPELGIDLCIRDADGRLTSFHDLNPRELGSGPPVPPNALTLNGFNAALALGIVRAAYHVSGDPAIGAYYYDDLVGTRDLPGTAAESAGLLFFGTATNYSNVNMLAIALATLGRFETDPGVRAKFGALLEHQFWNVDGDRDAAHARQPWFDVIYAASSASADDATLRDRISSTLTGFQTAPAIERDIVNCDDAEIAARTCVAIDGKTTIALEATPGWGGGVVAKDIVPIALRPDSNFAWRSDPHSVNGTGSTKMDPRGDWLTAYWFGRIVDASDVSKNLSPYARPPLPYGPSGAQDGAGADGSDSGCACATAGESGRASRRPGGLGLAALALLAAAGCLRGRRGVARRRLLR